MCITFCIITMNRTRWLANVLNSIRQYCPVKYQVKLLVIGQPDNELKRLLKADDISAIMSPVNLACGGGRRLLMQNISTKFDDAGRRYVPHKGFNRESVRNP